MLNHLVFLSTFICLLKSELTYKGYKEYPFTITGVVQADPFQTVIYNNDDVSYYTNYKNDSSLPYFNYRSTSAIQMCPTSKQYYRIGYDAITPRSQNKYFYKWRPNITCERYFYQKLQDSPAIGPDGGIYGIIKDQDHQDQIKLMKIYKTQGCSSYTTVDLGLNLSSSPFIRMHLFAQTVIMIVTEDQINIIFLPKFEIVQTLKFDQKMQKDYVFNISLGLNNKTNIFENNITFFSNRHYQIFQLTQDKKFVKTYSNDMYSFNNFIQFSLTNQTNFMDEKCRTFPVNLYSNTILQKDTKYDLGRVVAFNRDLNLYINQAGKVLELVAQTFQFKMTYQINLNLNQQVVSGLILSQNKFYYVTSSKRLYVCQINGQTKIIDDTKDIDLILQVQKIYPGQFSALLAINCPKQTKKCTIYNFANDTLQQETQFQLNGTDKQLAIQKFARGRDGASSRDYRYYHFLVFVNQGGQRVVYQLNKTNNNSQSWQLPSSLGMKIAKNYGFYLLNQSFGNVNGISLICFQVFPNKTTNVTSYPYRSISYTDPQKIVAIGASYSSKIVFVYQTGIIRTLSNFMYDRPSYYDYIRDVEKLQNIFVFNYSKAYYEINGKGWIGSIEAEKMRIISRPYQFIQSSVCSNSSQGVFKLRDLYFQYEELTSTVYLFLKEDNTFDVYSQISKDKNYTRIKISPTFNKTNYKIKSIRYDIPTDDLYMILVDQKQQKQHLIVQTLSNFAYNTNGRITWKLRYTSKKIDFFTVGQGYIVIVDLQSKKLLKYVVNQGQVKTKQLSYHVSPYNPQYMFCYSSSGTEVVSQNCSMINFLTNQIKFTIKNPPYMINYMQEIKFSPSGQYVLLAEILYKNDQRLGVLNFKKFDSSYFPIQFMTDNQLLFIQSYSISSIYNTTFYLFTFKQNPFNYSVIWTSIISTSKIFYVFNGSIIIVNANDTIIVMDKQFNVLQTTTHTQIGQTPESMFLTNQGNLMMTWNKLLFTWASGKSNDDDDHHDDNDGQDSNVGAIIGGVIGGIVFVAVAVTIFIKLRNRKKHNQSQGLLSSQNSYQY